MTLDAFHTYTEQTFDSFSKTTIRNESIDAFRELACRLNHEIPLSALPGDVLLALSSEDEYNKYSRLFSVQGQDVEVRDSTLGAVLGFIPAIQRDIVLLSYYLNYSDQEIAALLNMRKATVQYRRAVTLKRLRTLLEEMENG
ncbi:MAG TPA: RNA polymerase subunit sigma-70 [Lachnospiraceae bacterium]|jgi:DNA-directed RNA polymerase specialized sigma24 family protein|nr:RNA polymerase subunit sigma-70 [Lachnospiraceae bacterium]